MIFGFGTAAGPAVGQVAAGDFSFVDLLFDAHIVVQLVLIMLVIASLWSWAVIIEKWFTLGSLRKSAQKFEAMFWSGQANDMMGGPGQGAGDPASRVFASVTREWNDARRARNDAEIGILIGRAERAMRATVDREVGRASRGNGVLATVGSASPFIGLFGTVWGIMYAFINISANNDTSLANVAGPIAEALFATGLGLIAAIPAVIFYNKFTGDIDRFADQLDTFAQDILVRMSRRASESSEA
ncbi:MAG: MotA/TolQ/ExbB proton channel family protein [Pseudomonadota bacterium]